MPGRINPKTGAKSLPKLDPKDWNKTDLQLLKKYKPQLGYNYNSDSDSAARAVAPIRKKLEKMHFGGVTW